MAYTFVKIASINVGAGGASYLQFSSIPQNYTDLLIVCSLRGSYSYSGNLGLVLTVNSQTAGNAKNIEANGSGYASYTNASSAQAGTFGGNLITANSFSNTSIYITNYQSTGIKTFVADSAWEQNATSAFMNLIGSTITNGAAITSIILGDGTAGAGFTQYSTATLYGIKNS